MFASLECTDLDEGAQPATLAVRAAKLDWECRFTESVTDP